MDNFHSKNIHPLNFGCDSRYSFEIQQFIPRKRNSKYIFGSTKIAFSRKKWTKLYSFQWHHQLFISNLILPYLIINYSPECISDEIGTKYTSLMKQNIKTVNVIRKIVAWFSWAIFIRWHWVMKKPFSNFLEIQIRMTWAAEMQLELHFVHFAEGNHWRKLYDCDLQNLAQFTGRWVDGFCFRQLVITCWVCQHVDLFGYVT